MKKRHVVLLGTLIVIVSIVIMYTREDLQTVSLDETIFDVTRFKEYQNNPISWTLFGINDNPSFRDEISKVAYSWSLDGNGTSVPSMFQSSFMYKNKMHAGIAYYLNPPNRYYKSKLPNFGKSTGNYSKEADFELNANRYGFYCGIGPKDDCQVWYYWAQYDNYLVLLNLFDPGDGNSLEDFGLYVNELDKHLSNLFGD